MHCDYLIVGQGLAGTHVAWQALKRGEKPLVIDQYMPGAASVAAGGLVNPVTGKRLVKNWRADELIPFARETYQAQETLLGRQFYHLTDVVRLFKDEKQQKTWWNERRSDEKYHPYIKEEEVPYPVTELVNANYGGVSLKHGAFLNATDYLLAFRQYLFEKGLLEERILNYADLTVTEQGVRLGDIKANRVIFCEGWGIKENPFFKELPLRPVKGQVLIVDAPDLKIYKVINKGIWLIPIGNGKFRIGATYEHDLTTSKPSESAFQQLCEQLSNLLKVNYKVLNRQYGVRPSMKDSLPVTGWHPAYPTVGVLNGLGSKGVLQAPYLAFQLLNNIDDPSKIPEKMNVKRYL